VRKGQLTILKKDQTIGADDNVVAVFETDDNNPKRRKFDAVKPEPPVRIEGGEEVTDFTKLADSAFWTEAAVEKFVLPYYAHVAGVEAADKLRKAFNRDDVYAILHLPLSVGTLAVPLGLVSDIVEKNVPRLFTLDDFFALAGL
jgi:hypothetical protein